MLSSRKSTQGDTFCPQVIAKQNSPNGVSFLLLASVLDLITIYVRDVILASVESLTILVFLLVYSDEILGFPS